MIVNKSAVEALEMYKYHAVIYSVKQLNEQLNNTKSNGIFKTTRDLYIC